MGPKNLHFVSLMRQRRTDLYIHETLSRHRVSLFIHRDTDMKFSSQWCLKPSVEYERQNVQLGPEPGGEIWAQINDTLCDSSALDLALMILLILLDCVHQVIRQCGRQCLRRHWIAASQVAV